jgi:hypothetical protein
MLSAVVLGLRLSRLRLDLKEARRPVMPCRTLLSLARGGWGAVWLGEEGGGTGGAPPWEDAATVAAAVGEVGADCAAVGLAGAAAAAAGEGAEGAALVGMTGRADMVSRRNGSSSTEARVAPAEVSPPR